MQSVYEVVIEQPDDDSNRIMDEREMEVALTSYCEKAGIKVEAIEVTRS
jgi:hypothetical protein